MEAINSHHKPIFMVLARLNLEYLISSSKPKEAKISLNGTHIAKLSKEGNLTFKLVDERDGHEWIFSSKVHGEFRPFSLSISEIKNGNILTEVLTIREHLFRHNGKFYMLTNHPEGKSWNDYLNSPRYISRLDNFPFKDLEEIDHHTRQRIKRFRGIAVGEASGLGTDGHRVKVSNELQEIGLLIAAASFVLYSMG
ncbi:MAG: hypothetical protein WCA39_07150 [Nitrososphaeraceae archaeon]|jgi:hypothetical protein